MNTIYIGDNKKIMENITNKFEVIYIDPPYNTGNKFVYNDKKTSEAWYEFMIERIQLAKKIMQENGVIFISIDDNEVENLKNLCDEVFSSENYLGRFITNQSKRSNAKYINVTHEYILCYAKNKKNVSRFQINRMNIPRDRNMIENLEKMTKNEILKSGPESATKKLKIKIDEYCKLYNITWLRNYNKVLDDGSIYFATDLSTPGEPRKVDIPEIGLQLDPLPTRSWSSDKKFIQLYNEQKLHFNTDNRPYEIHLLRDSQDNVESQIDFYSRQGTEDLKRLGLSDIFDTPKPVEMIKYLIRIFDAKTDINILDFFAGSGTTGQAVYEVNIEDNKNHNFTLIQLDEQIEKAKQIELCRQFNIKETIDQMMILRLETFQKIHNIKNDIVIIKENDYE